MAKSICKNKLKVVIFGAGSAGVQAWEFIVGSYECEVLGFADNASHKHGTTLLELPIFSLEQLCELKVDRIFIASTFKKEISSQLLSMGFAKDRLVYLPIGRDRQHFHEAMVDALIGPCREDLFTAPQSEGVVKIVIYGTGSAAMKAWPEIISSEMLEVVCFVDSSLDKWGKSFLGKPIIAPGQIAATGCDLVIIASSFVDEITKTLMGVGISADIIKSVVLVVDASLSWEDMARWLVNGGSLGTALFLGTGCSPLLSQLHAIGCDLEVDRIRFRSTPCREKEIPGFHEEGWFPEECFDTVVVHDEIRVADLKVAIAELYHLCSGTLLVCFEPNDIYDSWFLGSLNRSWLEQLFLDAGFRIHPRFFELVSFAELEADVPSCLLAFEKIPEDAVALYPLDVLVGERDLHMDMLREAGRLSEAHLARYHEATSFLRPNSIILDTACGLGYGAAMLFGAGENVSVTAVDISEYAVGYAKCMFGEGRSGISFVQSDVCCLSFVEDNTVDLVVSFETIEHLECPELFLREVERVLKPGGQFIGSVPNDWSDETGKDSSPYPRHVFDFSRFHDLLEEFLFVDQAFAQVAGGHCSKYLSYRSWREFDFRQKLIPEWEQSAEWWILTAMKTPIGGEKIPYVESVFPCTMEKTPNVVNFLSEYQNPWLIHSLIFSNFRARSAVLLKRIASEVLRSYAMDTPDVGGALCVLAYQDSNSEDLHWIRYKMAAYLENEAASPHVLRWQVSLSFALARIEMKSGDQKSAMKHFSECSRMDFLRFAPHLGTKCSEAAFVAGWIAYLQKDLKAAREHWVQGVEMVNRVRKVPLSQMLVNEELPATFGTGDGLREITVIFDNAAKCANGLRALARIEVGVNPDTASIDKNFQATHLDYQRRLALRGG